MRLCPATYFIYQIIVNSFGYDYEKDANTTFYIMLGTSVIVGAYFGYNNISDD